MKPIPAPQVPGDTEAERFENALRKVLSAGKPTVRSQSEAKKPTLKKK